LKYNFIYIFGVINFILLCLKYVELKISGHRTKLKEISFLDRGSSVKNVSLLEHNVWRYSRNPY
jgi:hypothetical protein